MQVVLYGENPGNTIRADESVVFVCLRSYHAFKIHMTVLHDNVDRRYGLDTVIEQTRIVEDRPGYPTADAIVIERRRKYLDLVIHALNAFQVLHADFCRIFHNCVPHLAEQSNCPAVHTVSEIIENRKLRNHIQFVADFAGKPLFKPRTGAWSGLLGSFSVDAANANPVLPNARIAAKNVFKAFFIAFSRFNSSKTLNCLVNYLMSESFTGFCCLRGVTILNHRVVEGPGKDGQSGPWMVAIWPTTGAFCVFY